MRRAAALMILGALALAPATPRLLAEETRFVPIAIVRKGSDQLGSRFAYAVREGIRRSAGMTLVETEQAAFIAVHIRTVDATISTTETGRIERTAYSVVWTCTTPDEPEIGYFYEHNVGICSSSALSECADQVVAATDHLVMGLRQAFETGTRELPRRRALR